MLIDCFQCVERRVGYRQRLRLDEEPNMAAQPREDLHRLVDTLPESEVPKARSYLRFLHGVGADPLLQALMEAPEDDEPVTEEEEAAVREARAAIERGETAPWEVVKQELLPLAQRRGNQPARPRAASDRDPSGGDPGGYASPPLLLSG
jgi:hypothetical protein